MKFIKTDNIEEINALRVELYQKLTAPIDVMWEKLYIDSAQHFFIENNEENIGYCCIDDKGSLLQLFLKKEYHTLMNKVITSLIEAKKISSASLSSNEPISYNTCLHHSKSIATNTFCFQHSNTIIDTKSSLKLELALEDNIPSIKSFLKEQIGMDDTFGYTENLVARKEIYTVTNNDEIIATSECRWSDSQPEIADLGIIVNKNHRGKGIATQVLQIQANRVLKANRKPICSTTFDNIASRKAIERAGFYCSNIIFDMNFVNDNNK